MKWTFIAVLPALLSTLWGCGDWCNTSANCPHNTECVLNHCLPIQEPPPEACVMTGCSGQICADEHLASTCEWQDEYACYRDATCERQDTGACGWTMTPELEACLSGNTECDPIGCGPAPGMPNYLCPDGVSVGGPTGRCLRNEDGFCGWEILDCPPEIPCETSDQCDDGAFCTTELGDCRGDAVCTPDGMCSWPPATCGGVCRPRNGDGTCLGFVCMPLDILCAEGYRPDFSYPYCCTGTCVPE